MTADEAKEIHETLKGIYEKLDSFIKECAECRNLLSNRMTKVETKLTFYGLVLPAAVGLVGFLAGKLY